MDDPFERPRLSRSTLVVLALLGAANLLLVVYFVVWTPPAAPVGPAEDPVLGAGIRLLGELEPASEGAEAAGAQVQISQQEERGGAPVPDSQRQPVVAAPAEVAAQSAAGRPRAAPAPVEPAPPDHREPAPDEPELVCRRWGPLADTAALDEIRRQVEAAGEVVDVRPTELDTPPDYLVYLESDNNIDNARRLKQELDRQNIDAYVMAGGDYVTSVSAGVFSSENRAERQRRRLAELGYEPRIAVLRRMQAAQLLIGRVPADFEGGEQARDECAAIASAR